MPAQRKRKQFKFWLDILKPQEKYVGEIIQWLVDQGEFVRSIRDGIRLIYDLRFQRSNESLLELFPDIRERLRVTPATGGGGQVELAKEIAAQIILQGGTPGYLMQSTQHLGGLITPTDIEFLNRPKPATLAAAPPKAEIKQAVSKVTADEIADNMLNMLSMFD